jgi:hypothetical protein
MKVTARVCLIAAALLTGCSSAAQESSGNWDIAVWVSGSTGEELTNSFGEAQLWSAGVFVGRPITAEIGRGWRRGRLEYGMNLLPVFVQSRPRLLYGGGFEPVVLRWNSNIRLREAHPYVELAGGVLRSTGNLPSGDTSNFNFIASGGGGLQVALKGKRFMDLGVRWEHVSNANLGTRNPEFNGIEVRVGYRWMR